MSFLSNQIKFIDVIIFFRVTKNTNTTTIIIIIDYHQPIQCNKIHNIPYHIYTRAQRPFKSNHKNIGYVSGWLVCVCLCTCLDRVWFFSFFQKSKSIKTHKHTHTNIEKEWMDVCFCSLLIFFFLFVILMLMMIIIIITTTTSAWYVPPPPPSSSTINNCYDHGQTKQRTNEKNIDGQIVKRINQPNKTNQ